MIHSSGQKIELDIYIDEIKLAFEYQGEQHYQPLYWMQGDYEARQAKDREKRETCKQVLNNPIITAQERNYVDRSSLLVG